MYHIKDDKRSAASAALLMDALERCLQRRPFEEVSITEICREATVSRATFYRLFDTPEDIIAYRYECFAAGLDQNTGSLSAEQIMVRFFSVWMAHPEVMELILRINREDILFDCHRRHMAQIQYSLQKRNPQLSITEYHISILTGILIGVLTTWIRTGKQESAPQLVAKVQSCIHDFAGLLAQ